MAQHAGQLGRHKPFYPEHDVKLLTICQTQPLYYNYTKEKRK